MSHPFARAGLPTGRDVIDAIEARADLSAKEKAEIRSSWNKASEWLGIPLEKLIAHSANLRPRLARLSPTALGITKKRLYNVRRDLKRSMRDLSPDCRGKSFKVPFTSEIQQLHGRIGCKYTSAELNCLLRYISAQELPLCDVDDGVASAALEAMLEDGLHKRPRIVHQNACRSWNRLVDRFPELGLRRLTAPRYNEWQALSRKDVPPHLLDPLDAFLSRGRTPDPFDLSSPIDAWSRATIKTYDVNVRRYLGLLARDDSNLDQFPTLSAAARPDLVIATFDKLGLRKTARGRARAAAIAMVLAQISEDEAQREIDEAKKKDLLSQATQLKKLSRRLRELRERSTKNQDRLAKLKDEANLARLFLLPFVLEKELAKIRKPKRRRDALLMQWTVALCILMFCPLRISSLSLIRLDRNLSWARPDMRGSLILKFAAGELKNGEPASLPLPPECARLIREYITRFRPVLTPEERPFLFPGASGEKPKLSGVLSGQISRLIDDRIGLPVNPHLYRHVVHLIVLRRFPGAYAMVARVLTHRSIATTIKNYSHFDVEIAMRAYHRLVRSVQDGTHESLAAAPNIVAYTPEEF